MPHKRLPTTIVGRIRRASERFLTTHRFERMQNVDHRARGEPYSSKSARGRVRLAEIKHGDKKIKVVIKRVHDTTSKELVELLTKKTKQFNQSSASSRSVLLAPRAYPILENYVAMAYTDRPNVLEITSDENRTERGRYFFSRLIRRQRMRKQPISRTDLDKAALDVQREVGIFPRNLLLMGYRNGKFIFMPLVDLR